MAQHGYLRDYDEERDRDRDDDRRGEDRERGWRGNRNFSAGDRDEGFLFRDRDRSGERGDWERASGRFRSGPDDHYLSWRDKQMEALDRDYAEYCREREQEFHRNFDAWRSRRRSNPEPLQTGMTQSAQERDPTEALELTREQAVEPGPQADPIAAATLGTTSSSRSRG